MLTKTELALEQSQQGASNNVLGPLDEWEHPPLTEYDNIKLDQGFGTAGSSTLTLACAPLASSVPALSTTGSSSLACFYASFPSSALFSSALISSSLDMSTISSSEAENVLWLIGNLLTEAKHQDEECLLHETHASLVIRRELNMEAKEVANTAESEETEDKE
nr:hypothetical protein [Tanacetum cinerariifolium]